MIKRNLHILVMSIVAVLIVYGFIISGIDSKRLLRNTKYTITTVTSDWHHKNNTGVGVDYVYYVNGKSYGYTINLDLKKNEKYLLAYDSLKPSNCQVLQMYPLTEDVSSPVNGWNLHGIPIKVDSLAIVQYIEDNK